MSSGAAGSDAPGAVRHEASLPEGLAVGEGSGASPLAVMVVQPPAPAHPAHQHRHRQRGPEDHGRSRLGGQAAAPALTAPAPPREARTLEMLAEVMAEVAALRNEVRVLRDEQL